MTSEGPKVALMAGVNWVPEVVVDPLPSGIGRLQMATVPGSNQTLIASEHSKQKVI